MRIFHQSLWLAASVTALVGVLVGPALARQTTVTGTATTSYDFRERSYDQGDNVANRDEGDVQKMGIGPGVTVVSKGINDVFSFNYSPLLNYDFVTDSSGVDHQLNLSGERSLSRYWSFTLTDDFIRSDDPSSASTASTTGIAGQPPISPGNELSRDLSGQKFWTNTAALRTAYALGENSRIGGGYSYSVLRNDSGNNGLDNLDDYDKHAFTTDFSHGFNRNWRSSLGLNYTRGLYDNTNVSAVPVTSADMPDLNEYGTNLGVDYIDSVKDFFPFKYSFNTTQYDGDTRLDSEAHQWSAGWDHAFDARSRLAMGGGPSFAKTEGLEGSWGYNAYLTFSKKYEHASYALQLNKQFETRNFTGSANDSGLTDTYNATASFNYQYTQSLALDLFGRYSWQSILDPQGLNPATGTTGDNSSDKNIYEAGAGFSYSFAQWYKAGVKYVYYVSDGDQNSEQYTDHQLLFTLSATKEFWRW